MLRVWSYVQFSICSTTICCASLSVALECKPELQPALFSSKRYIYIYIYVYSPKICVTLYIFITNITFKLQSMKLSQKSLCETNIGQIINLISNDVSRFDLLFNYLHFLWVGPLQIILTTAVLFYHNIGVASSVGLIVMVFAVPLQRMPFKKKPYLNY